MTNKVPISHVKHSSEKTKNERKTTAHYQTGAHGKTGTAEKKPFKIKDTRHY